MSITTATITAWRPSCASPDSYYLGSLPDGRTVKIVRGQTGGWPRRYTGLRGGGLRRVDVGDTVPVNIFGEVKDRDQLGAPCGTPLAYFR
jgi:hypothetical protein